MMEDNIPPAASVVITTFNSPIPLYDCLVALQRSTFSDFEIIVVNNGPLPLKELIDSHFTDRRIRVVASGKNTGYAGGNNFGAAHARGRIIAFVNDDVVVHPEWLARIVASFTSEGRVDLISSKVFMMRHFRTLNSIGQAFSLSLRANNMGDGEDDTGQYSVAGRVFAASGPAFAMRREVFDDLGGFSSEYFLYYEDIDFCWRAYLRGWNCWFLPQAIAFHYRNESVRKVPVSGIHYSLRNRLVTLVRNHGLFSLLIAMPAIGLYDLHYLYDGYLVDFRLSAIRDGLAALWNGRRRAACRARGRSSLRLLGAGLGRFQVK